MTDLSIYTVGGAVQAGGGIYIPRQADEQLLELCQGHTFASVLSPRQMGKSSLMVRTAARLESEGYRSGIVDLEGIGSQASAEEWYLGLLDEIKYQLDLKIDVVAWWRDRAHQGSTQRVLLFFRELLLSEVAEPIIIFLDEIDTALKLSFTDDFFAVIRALHEARVLEPALARLSFVLIGVASAGDLIRDRRRTPFNIGQLVDLTDFTFEEALPFADGLGLPSEMAQQVLGWVLTWTGGHPYLTQRLCSEIAQQSIEREGWSAHAVDQLVISTFFNEKSDQDNNLQFVRDMLIKRLPEVSGVLIAYNVLDTYRTIWRGRRQVYDNEQSIVKSHLKLSGIVRREGRILKVRNQIYHRVFNERWVKEHIPINWPKQLQRLAIIGLILSLVISIISFVIASNNLVAATVANRTAEAAGKTADDARLKAEAEARAAATAQAGAEANAITAFYAQATATDAGLLAQLRALIIQAQAELDRDPEFSLLIALESTKKQLEVAKNQKNDLVAEALRQSYHAFPLHTVLDVPATPIRRAIFSPDSQMVITASDDATIQIWERSAGDDVRSHVIAVLHGHTGAVRDLAIDPGGTSLASASDDGTARIWDLKAHAQRLTLKGHTGEVRSVSWSSNGQVPLIVTASEDGTARLWDAIQGTERAVLRHGAPLRSAAFSPNNQSIVTVGENGSVRIWNTERTSRPAILENQAALRAAVFSPDSRSIATGSEDGTVQIWSTSQPRVLLTFPGHTRAINSVSWSPDGRILVAASDDRTARLWDTTNGSELGVLRHDVPVMIATFGPDGQSLATISEEGTAYIWDVATGNKKFLLRSRAWKVDNTAWSSDGRFIVTAGSAAEGKAGAAHIWDVGLVRQVLMAPNSETALSSIMVSPDGRYVALVLGDEPPLIREMGTKNVTTTLHQARQPITLMRFSPNSQQLLTASMDGTVQIWATGSGAEVATLQGHTAEVLDASFSADGTWVATASGDATTRLWDIRTKQELAMLQGHSRAVRKVAFSPDGQTIVTAGADGAARLWDTATAIEQRTLRSDGVALNDVAWSPDGSTLVTTSENYIVRIWDAQAGTEPIARLEGHTAPVTAVAFSPDGQSIVTASEDNTARLWKPSKTTPATHEDNTAKVWRRSENPPFSTIILYGHEDQVTAASFSSDGHWVLTAGDDGTVRLWGTETGRLLAVFYGHQQAVASMALRSDQQQIVTASLDRTVRIYHCDVCIEATLLFRLAPSRAIRELTQDEKAQLDASLLPLPTVPTNPEASATLSPTPVPTRTPVPTVTPTPITTNTPTATLRPTAPPLPVQITAPPTPVEPTKPPDSNSSPVASLAPTIEPTFTIEVALSPTPEASPTEPPKPPKETEPPKPPKETEPPKPPKETEPPKPSKEAEPT
jgi:WD40 repeat protein